MNLKNKLFLMLLSICATTFTSCSTDDEIPVPNVIRTGTFTVEDQTLNAERLTISNINVSQQSYLVLRQGGADGEIIAPPKLIQRGESTNVTFRLYNDVELSDGETITAVLHKDTYNLGFFDFDGESEVDVPITNDAGEIVMDTFTVTVLPDPTGSLTIEDQALVNNMLTVESITLDRSGYVVVHADTADTGANAPVVPEIISEPVYLEAGTHTDVEIMINESADVNEGDTVWIMLHTDTGTEEVYEFDGQSGFDIPILDEEGEIVMTPIMITDVMVMMDATGSLTVTDQMLVNRTVTIDSIIMGQPGYVVIHADNGSGGPMIPEIISQPVYLEEGTYQNVVVPLEESATVEEGDTLWAMLHNDSGTEEVYEFDGENGLDLPIMMDGNIVMESFMITAVEEIAVTGTLTVEDQALVDNTITVGPITLQEDGWVVVHADNGMNGPVVPEIISMPVYLEAGTHTDVEISFEDTANVEVGDTVWVMLHDDSGRDGVYEFNGTNGLDLPIVVDDSVVVKPVIIIE